MLESFLLLHMDHKGWWQNHVLQVPLRACGRTGARSGEDHITPSQVLRTILVVPLLLSWHIDGIISGWLVPIIHIVFLVAPWLFLHRLMYVNISSWQINSHNITTLMSIYTCCNNHTVRADCWCCGSVRKKLNSGVRVSKEVSEKSWKSQSWQKCSSKKLVELELTFLISSKVHRVRVSLFVLCKSC